MQKNIFLSLKCLDNINIYLRFYGQISKYCSKYFFFKWNRNFNLNSHFFK